MKYDFSGWATRNNLLCSDGRTIRKDAFKNNDGKKVPLVWNHQHTDPINVLGHALLENREDGVYAYCSFNDTPSGQNAKLLVEHGDVCALSIYANKLKQNGGNVIHGEIKEVSLVLAGANPGAFIDSVMAHGDDENDVIVIQTNEQLIMNRLEHADSDDEDKEKKMNSTSEKEEEKETESKSEDKEAKKSEDEETVGDVFNTMTDKQKNAVYALIQEALMTSGEDEDEKKKESDDSKGGNTMKHNVFDSDQQDRGATLTHADQENILNLAKSSSVGSFQEALSAWADQNALQHDFDDIDILFPEYKDVRPGAPEFISRDQGWVSVVMQKIHKSPISRIRTRQADIRGTDLRAYGYTKGAEKVVPGNVKLLKRTTDPQTIYRKDALNRDDIIDITDFDVVQYQYQVMRQNLNEEIALAIMIGDGRDDGDDYKVSEDHVRSIWNDDDVYTIHYDVDVDTFASELQGTNTSANFGENYIYAEAIIQSALYAREDYKGTGTPDFFCTPHLLNVMLLARDLNGRRVYESKSELEKALNVGGIYTAEQFEGLTRTTSDNLTKELLGLFVNLTDYTVGSTKGGEITKFNQFDIDFNQEKYLIETRISGALTRAYSAVALEKDVTESTSEG